MGEIHDGMQMVQYREPNDLCDSRMHLLLEGSAKVFSSI